MIRQQLELITASFAIGMLVVFLYDIILIFREIIRRRFFWIALEDFLFWTATAIAVFCVIYRINEGIVRGYAICGFFLGMFVLQWSVGERMVKFITKIVIRIRKYLKKLYYRCRIKVHMSKV